MALRVIIGILLGYLIIAYFPLILKKIHYIFIVVLCLLSAYFLRAAPLLAEPISFGLLIVIVCYITFLSVKHKGNFKALYSKAKEKNLKLPAVNIANHPQISVLINIIAYTVALTFLAYMVILLIFVN